MFSGVFVGDAGGVRDKWSGNTKIVGVQTILEAFFNTSVRSARFVDEAKLLLSGLLSSSVELSDGRLNKFCCTRKKCWGD
jgi:hypothetical protein